MLDDTAELAILIGRRIRQERQSRHWTLDQLAEAAGVSRRMVVNVEQGGVNPSVGTLLRLAEALGVGLPALVAPPEPAAVRITRAGEGAQLWTGPAGGRGILVAGNVAGSVTGSGGGTAAGNGALPAGRVGSRPPVVLELWDWTLAAGERHAAEAHLPGTFELLHLLDGAFTLEVDGQQVELTAGDAVAFRGDVPHAYRNDGTEPARFSLVVHEPGAGSTAPRIPTATGVSR